MSAHLSSPPSIALKLCHPSVAHQEFSTVDELMAATRQDGFHHPPMRLAARAFTIAPGELPVIGAGRHL